MSEIPQDVRALAAGIADDIERNGHYQGVGKSWVPAHPDWKCCVVDSPTYNNSAVLLRSALIDLLPRIQCSVVCWNDRTPTAEVLGTLRKIAAGERP
jgi:hypothetical protein